MILVLAVSVACAGSSPTSTIAITNVAVVDVEHGVLLPDRTVLVQGSRIARVAPVDGPGVPPGAQIVDGTGRFLIPGLWDMHVHVDDERTAARLLAWGITGARIMSGGLDETLALRQMTHAHPARGPRLLVSGLALRGPQSTTDTALAVVRTATDGRTVVDSLAARGVDLIKVHEGLSREAWFAIARSARRRGLVLVGHVPAGLTPEEASDSGLRGIEHLEFVPDRCLTLFDSTARAGPVPLAVGCRPQDLLQLLQHLHRNGVWLDPTIGSFRVWAPRQWRSIHAGFADLVPLIARVGIPVLAGTDTGDPRIAPGESLHDELSLLVAAGFSPVAALRAATWNPPRLLGLGDSVGLIAPGYVADLVLLEGNPFADVRHTSRIAAVIRAGSLLSAETLNSLRR